jgi:CrcB protein
MSILHNLTALNFLAVGAGAAFGAWTRWLLGMALNPLFFALPLGTLAANVIGGYLVGVAVGCFTSTRIFRWPGSCLPITGFLGGLTTFSTFSAEVVERLLAGQPMLGHWSGYPPSGGFADGDLFGFVDSRRDPNLELNTRCQAALQTCCTAKIR